MKNLDTQHRIRQNDILETGLAARKSIDELGNDAFGGASSAGWYERNGGVWMDNLRENKFGGRNLSPEKQAALRGSLAKKGKEAEIIEEGKKLLSGLMQTDLPEINEVKPYFAPGGNDKTFEAYLQHQLSGSAKNDVYGPVQSERLASLHLASESLSSPDFIFSQKNGNKYFGTVYNYGRGDTMHVVITEMEKDGRIREITQFVTSDRNNKIEDAIRKNIKDACPEPPRRHPRPQFNIWGQTL